MMMMELGLDTYDFDYKGRPRGYFLVSAPAGEHVRSLKAPGSSDLPEHNYPSLEELGRDQQAQLDLIHLNEANERMLAKVSRVIVDLALQFPGTVATAGVAGYETFHYTRQWIPTIFAGIGGLMAHEMGRRPIVGARHLYNQWRNPWSPAAQSTARIRSEALET